MSTSLPLARRRHPLAVRATLLLVLVAVTALVSAPASAAGPTARRAGRPDHPSAIPAAAHPRGAPDLGPNVYVFDAAMPLTQIQATVNAIAAEQVSNQFGTQRYALLFEPGTYGTAADPLNFDVGYYTEVAGLGASPDDVVIHGSVDVRNQCQGTYCTALNNFWRSLSNLTIDVPSIENPPCDRSAEFWAVSQAAPMRRVHITGLTTLMDYCTGPAFASGGFIADSRLDGTVINGGQQQFYVRNSTLGSWTNGVWNQVFSGVNGAPAQCFPGQQGGCGPYTTLATTPASRGKPFLYVDGSGTWRVFVPGAQRNSVGEDWSSAGRSIPLSDFYIARPSDSIQTINARLARGDDLLLTPGVYDVDRSIKVKRPDAVVLGLGLATLTSVGGAVPLTVADVPGVDIAGLTIDAGPVDAPALLRVGTRHAANGAARQHNHWSNPADPTGLQDVFFRVGGPHPGKADVSLEINSDNVILDDIWAWRADHGAGVGWDQNTAANGVVVNGDSVTATGLFVEHYQRFQVVWNGEDGTDVFFQSEMPYDVPSQQAWSSAPGTLGYASFKVTGAVTRFTGYGMGTYSFFNRGIDIYASHAYEVPVTPGVRLHDLLTVFLDATNGSGGILHVVNDTGGSSTAANPDVPVTVVDYP